MLHQFVKSIILLCILTLICSICSSCTLVDNKETHPAVATEDKKNAEKMTKSLESTSIDGETESLLKLYENMSNSENSSNEKSDKTNTFVEKLYQYLHSHSDLKYLAQISRLDVIEPSCRGAYVFNLVRYDADPIGIGTLERTWSLLQIINEDDIDVYRVYDKSAEFPLYFKVKDGISKDGKIIAIAGATNVSRSKSAFISFWIYNDDSLEKFTNINLLSDYDGDRLLENEYIIEYSDEKIMQIIDNEEDYGLYDIIADDFKIGTTFKDGQINIVFTKFD